MPCCLHLGRCTVTGSASLRAVGLSLSPFDQCTWRATCNAAHVPCNLQHNAHLACNTAQAAAVHGRRVMAVASQSQKPYISWQSVELPPAHTHTHTHTQTHTQTQQQQQQQQQFADSPLLFTAVGYTGQQRCTFRENDRWCHLGSKPPQLPTIEGDLLAACMRDVTLRSHSTDVYTEISQPKRAVAVAE